MVRARAKRCKTKVSASGGYLAKRASGEAITATNRRKLGQRDVVIYLDAGQMLDVATTLLYSAVVTVITPRWTSYGNLDALFGHLLAPALPSPARAVSLLSLLFSLFLSTAIDEPCHISRIYTRFALASTFGFFFLLALFAHHPPASASVISRFRFLLVSCSPRLRHIPRSTSS